jgi:hypothetical protein
MCCVTVLRRQHQQQQLLGVGDFGEMGSMEIVDYIPVDSDELVPSLQVSVLDKVVRASIKVAKL